jgi:hypothetical protein
MMMIHLCTSFAHHKIKVFTFTLLPYLVYTCLYSSIYNEMSREKLTWSFFKDSAMYKCRMEYEMTRVAKRMFDLSFIYYILSVRSMREMIQFE